jgi:chain length determinant protein (polysaccharide antigen chain regulator)
MVLKEALAIANASGLVEPISLGQVQKTGNSQSAIKTIAGSNILYMRGSRLLSAELEGLKNRKKADAFVPGLRDLQGKLELLKAIKLDPAQIRVARLDQPAYPPSSPIKPKRKLILALGLLLGLMLGVFAAFFANFLEKQRAAEHSVKE